jgi:transcriptional regulator with XRE-family HTH domain
MRFADIGQQLRAYRLESGLRADEIAARLGVSRAALYRYEKGEVIKLDTVRRLAELLKVSPLSLLGIGVEYYNRPAGFQERMLQIEESADQILQVGGSVCYLTTSDAFDSVLANAFAELVQASAENERPTQQAAVEQIIGLLNARKRVYAARKPGIIAMLSAASMQRLLQDGLAGALALSEHTREACRRLAQAEVENIATIMESEPMGLQFGLLPELAEQGGTFQMLRSRDRATLAVNPFPPDLPPNAQLAVTIITSADDAIAAHQRVAEAAWREAVKGSAAASRVRQMLASARASARHE